MPDFIRVLLNTGPDGRAVFQEQALPLDQGHEQLRLSEVLPVSGMQWRTSPVGFRSAVHVSQVPQWVFIVSGIMEIGLPDGSTRQFRAGEHFYSNDTLPEGASFDPQVHGHWSRQVGEEPLVTLFIRG